MPPSEARARLAEQQAGLVRALVAGGEVPAGFDAERVRLAARSLVHKRVREVARAWPALGPALLERFRAYAAAHPPPPHDGPFADGRAFLRSVPRAELGDELRQAVFWGDLRGWTPRWAWLPTAGRLLLGVRLPWLGVRVVALPVAIKSAARAGR